MESVREKLKRTEGTHRLSWFVLTAHFLKRGACKNRLASLAGFRKVMPGQRRPDHRRGEALPLGECVLIEVRSVRTWASPR
jgi:hypothetical protein